MKKGKSGKKKGISPIIATVLLIVLAIAIAVLIWSFTRSLIKEGVTKDNILAETVCVQSVGIEASIGGSLENGDIIIENTGNVPIAGFNLKLIKQGSSLSRFFESPLESGQSSYDLYINFDMTEFGSLSSDCEQAEITPVILGSSSGSGGGKLWTCQEKTVYLDC